MKNMKKVLALLLALAMVFALAACGKSDPTTSSNPSSSNPSSSNPGTSTDIPASDEPVITVDSPRQVDATTYKADVTTTDKTQLVVGIAGESANWDALSQSGSTTKTVGSALYDSLFVMKDGELVGDLVESWEYTGEGGLDLVLHLREGVYFHNGTPFTAEDALYTISRVASDMVYAGRMEAINVEASYAENDTTLVLKLNYVDNLALATLTGECGFVVSKAYYEELGSDAAAQTPVGTGPYKFDHQSYGEYVVLTANTEYWGEAPAFESIKFVFFTEDTTRILELESGNLDVAIASTNDSINRLATGNSGVSIYSWVVDKICYLSLGTASNDKLFDNTDLRLAIAHAIDIDAVVAAIAGSTGVRATGFWPMNFWGYSDAQYTYDPELAKQYLASAGYPNGVEFTITVTSGLGIYESVAQAIQAYLGMVGITMHIETGAEFATVIGQITGNSNCGLMDGTMRGDINELLEAFRNGGGNLLTTIMDEHFNELIQKARVEVDQDVRAEILDELQQIMYAGAYSIPLYQYVGSLGYQSYVLGIEDAAFTSELSLDVTALSFAR